MIIWSGWGFLVVVIAFGASLAMEVVTEALVGDDRFYQTEAWPLALALALSGVIIWGLGKYVYARGAKVVIDKVTGQELTIGGEHRFFFIPMHYWGPVLIGLSVLPFIVR
ncbi:MAG TPA: hypothetical protein VHJ77_10050 [Vicinamibacterales bacterium]|jgi:hypothetical protein|nr:hypothetical protein [Vicinamibacterales bacterium]